MSGRYVRWKQQRLEERRRLLRQRAEYEALRAKYPPQSMFSTFVDWLAVYVAFQSFIFLVAWQAYPEWDSTQIWPTFVRSALVALPITFGMWGVARALRRGSAVPQEMAKKIPYGKVGADGTVGGTTMKDEQNGAGVTPIVGADQKEETDGTDKP